MMWKEGGYVLLVTNKEVYKEDIRKKNAKSLDFSLKGPSVEVHNGVKEYNGEVFRYRKPAYDFIWKDINPKSGAEFYYVITEIGEGEELKPEDTPYEAVSISSISDLLEIFRNEDLSNVLFRGQLGLCYPMLPKVLREEAESYEKDLFTEIITKHPDDYLPLSNLERLSRMQHREIPTRMLDVSRSPLTSLFFAVSSMDDGDYEKLNLEGRIKKAIDPDGRLSIDSMLKEKNAERIAELCNDESDAIAVRCKTSWLMYFRDAEVKEFYSGKCRLLAALPYLKGSEQSQLRYEAIMDYLIQCYAEIILQRFSNRSDFEKKVIKDAIRFYFGEMIFHGSSSNGHNVRSEVTRKTAAKYSYCRSEALKIAESINVAVSSDRIAFSTHGFSCRYFDNHCIITPESISDKPSEIKSLVYRINQDTEEPFLIDPETGNYYSSILNSLHEKIMLECPSFEKSIKALDILNGTFVSPVVNTPRMIAQQGLFMLYGLSAFWDINSFISYMCSENARYKDCNLFESIIRAIIFNDSSLFLPHVSESLDFIEEDKLIDFMVRVFNARLIRIKPDRKEDILNELRFRGISKETIGRSESTTYYEVDRRKREEKETSILP